MGGNWVEVNMGKIVHPTSLSTTDGNRYKAGKYFITTQMIGYWRTGNWKKRWRGVCCHICGQTEHEITLTPLHPPPSDDWWKPWSFIRADLHCHLCTFLLRPDLSQIDTRLWFTGSPPPSHPWLHPGFCQPFKDISCSFGSLLCRLFSIKGW